MPIRFALFVALCVVLTAVRARALDCAHAETQADMTACAGNDYKAADGKLNAAWKKASAALKGEASRLAKLKTAQRAWIAYRDAACDFEASAMEGGSAEPMVRAECLTRLTEQRTKDLDAAQQSAE